MIEILKRIFDELLAKPSIRLALFLPSPSLISLMRMLNGIQLSTAQLMLISKLVKTRPSCRFLVFGLGNDSLFWARLNQNGKTIFLEDCQYWIDRVKKRSGDISVCLVDYDSSVRDYQKLMDNPALLELSMPEPVANSDWDVILVDAPPGYNDNTPGRMKSIFMGMKLIENSGDVFVHDCGRKIEALYCDHFLKQENFQEEIKSTVGDLRHYRFGQPKPLK